MTDAIVDARDLTRRFVVRRKVSRLRRRKEVVSAVDSVSFRVDRAEAVGYVGPNGSGKSTTIKMLTGILTPSAGTVRTCGLDPSARRRELAGRLGLVFGQRSQLWWDLPLRDSFDLLRAIYGVGRAAHADRLAECIALLGLDDLLAVPVRQLSLGQRMRGEVTAALLHDPELLVLDEPTIGLDMESKERLRTFLGGLTSRRGTTILLTSHDLDDIEQICERLIVIDHGAVVADGPLARLRTEFAQTRELLVDLDTAHSPLSGLTGVVSVATEADGRRQRLEFDRAAVTAAELIAEVAGRAPVHDVSVREPGIDNVLRSLYARSAETAARR